MMDATINTVQTTARVIAYGLRLMESVDFVERRNIYHPLRQELELRVNSKFEGIHLES
jgi:hypothetical protein